MIEPQATKIIGDIMNDQSVLKAIQAIAPHARLVIERDRYNTYRAIFIRHGSMPNYSDIIITSVNKHAHYVGYEVAQLVKFGKTRCVGPMTDLEDIVNCVQNML